MFFFGIVNYFTKLFTFFLLLILIYNTKIILSENVKRVFKFINSFRAPQLAQSDSSIFFWTMGGDAKANYDRLRLVSSFHSSGWAWNSKPFVFF